MPPSPACPAAGRQWTERRPLAALKAVLKPLGMSGKLHTFRHYFISNALLNKTPEAYLARRDKEAQEIRSKVERDLKPGPSLTEL
jgi:hypothetical protein